MPSRLPFTGAGAGDGGRGSCWSCITGGKGVWVGTIIGGGGDRLLLLALDHLFCLESAASSASSFGLCRCSPSPSTDPVATGGLKLSSTTSTRISTRSVFSHPTFKTISLALLNLLSATFLAQYLSIDAIHVRTIWASGCSPP